MREINNKTIIEMLTNCKSGYLSFKQFASMFACESVYDKSQLDRELTALTKDKAIVYDKHNRRYSLAEDMGADTFEAIVDAQPRGYAFLIQDGVENDMFVSVRNTAGAMHRDKVIARAIPNTEDEAEIISIISRGMPEVVGTYDKSNNARFVIPDEKKFNRDIYIPVKGDMQAKDGQKVVVRITSYPVDRDRRPEGEIIQILGYQGEHNADMLAVAHAFGIRTKFPDEVVSRADKIDTVVPDKALVDRADYRDKLIITIDGADAKDLDDAISIDKHSDGTYTLGVHIADVSHYVKPGDFIDTEAFVRGTSTYLPQMVFPMLPTKLSNGICSLFEGVDRLTLSCNMHVDTNGEVLDFEVANSVIRSRHRMTYSDAQGILDGNKELCDKYSDIVDMLHDMSQLANILIERRDARGNINFASNEVKFITNDKGHVVDVVPYESLHTHKIIEQFMVLANETTAQYCTDSSVPSVYRVHAKPDPEKLATLVSLLNSVGIAINAKHAEHSTALAQALTKAEGKYYYKLVNTVMLRTMQKAKYSTDNIGHYGLASTCYCHFTSPIRRYPDLMVHRVLKTLISGKMTDKALSAYKTMCQDASLNSSITEKKAEEAERKAVDIKLCQYANTMLGEQFDGVISGVTENGIFVELPNTVEGFIRCDRLPGTGLSYNAKAFSIGNNQMQYRLGDKLTVIIDSVNISACKIDMALVKPSK